MVCVQAISSGTFLFTFDDYDPWIDLTEVTASTYKGLGFLEDLTGLPVVVRNRVKVWSFDSGCLSI